MRLFWKRKRNREFSLLITATCLLSGSPEVNQDSGLGEIFVCGLIPESRKFCFWIRNLWALDSGIQLRESGIQFRIGIRTAVPGIRNPRHGIQNTRLSWIPWGESVKGVRLPVNGFIRKERFETETFGRRLVEGNVKWQGMLKWSAQLSSAQCKV